MHLRRLTRLPVSVTPESVLRRLSVPPARADAAMRRAAELHTRGLTVSAAFLEVPAAKLSAAFMAPPCVRGLLADCAGALLMASTCPWAKAQIEERLKKGDAYGYAMVNAAAAEAADSGLDTVMTLVSSELRRSGRRLTKKRISPGYADIPLSLQEEIFYILELSNLSMSIDRESFMLSPEKSVIAIAGVTSL